jgi:NADH dehydrogenase (ubiquinone) 1 alpha subcomplex subunit 2
MKKHNPETPILIREAAGVAPKVWARYGRNRQRISRKPEY